MNRTVEALAVGTALFVVMACVVAIVLLTLVVLLP